MPMGFEDVKITGIIRAGAVRGSVQSLLSMYFIFYKKSLKARQYRMNFRVVLARMNIYGT